jgi:hypothetical protein
MVKEEKEDLLPREDDFLLSGVVLSRFGGALSDDRQE